MLSRVIAWHGRKKGQRYIRTQTQNQNISGLAVVDQEGVLKSAISITDLKVNILWKSVFAFLYSRPALDTTIVRRIWWRILFKAIQNYWWIQTHNERCVQPRVSLIISSNDETRITNPWIDSFPIVAPRTHYSRAATPLKGLYVTPNSTFEVDSCHTYNLHC